CSEGSGKTTLARRAALRAEVSERSSPEVTMPCQVSSVESTLVSPPYGRHLNSPPRKRWAGFEHDRVLEGRHRTDIKFVPSLRTHSFIHAYPGLPSWANQIPPLRG